MKTRNKALLLALCAVLLVTASVLGTMAYLTASVSVTNTFTVGKVAITLDEAPVDVYGVQQAGDRVDANIYKLIPGHTYTKDPTITVSADSENCWLFAKIDNGLGDDGAITIDTEKWTQVNGATNVYAYYKAATANEEAVVFETFTFASDAIPASYADKKIVVTAYAVQKDTFATAQAAWDATFGA